LKIGKIAQYIFLHKQKAKSKMNSHIQVKLFASLQEFTPPSSDKYPIAEDSSIHSLLEKLSIPPGKAKLIFINGVKADLSATLKGGERVGIFPPVGGG
jgi:molybdopterin converting factor small subunit